LFCEKSLKEYYLWNQTLIGRFNRMDTMRKGGKIKRKKFINIQKIRRLPPNAATFGWSMTEALAGARLCRHCAKPRSFICSDRTEDRMRNAVSCLTAGQGKKL